MVKQGSVFVGLGLTVLLSSHSSMPPVGEHIRMPVLGSKVHVGPVVHRRAVAPALQCVLPRTSTVVVAHASVADLLHTSSSPQVFSTHMPIAFLMQNVPLAGGSHCSPLSDTPSPHDGGMQVQRQWPGRSLRFPPALLPVVGLRGTSGDPPAARFGVLT